MPEGAPRVGAVVLARDRLLPTAATLEALLDQDPPPDRLVLVDNAGAPEVRAVLDEAAASHPHAEVLHLDRHGGSAGGFAAGIDRLLERDDIDLVCVFDDDAQPLPGCLAALTQAVAELPDVGAVGAVSHDPEGMLAWPMYVEGEPAPAQTLEEVREIGRRRDVLPVPHLAFHGLLVPADVLREHGGVWADLFLQSEDLELCMRIRAAGLRIYLVPDAECLHPAPPASRAVRVMGRQIDITAQNPAKEYLTLRNGLVVRHRHEGLRFWYGTGPLVLLRGLLSALALDAPKRSALRHVFLRGVFDALTGRLGPPPRATAQLGTRPPTRRQ